MSTLETVFVAQVGKVGTPLTSGEVYERDLPSWANEIGWADGSAAEWSPGVLDASKVRASTLLGVRYLSEGRANVFQVTRERA